MSMREFSSETEERKFLQELAGASLKEQRARRRWGVFFKLLFFAYLLVVTLLAVGGLDEFDGRGGGITPGGGHAALIDIQGPIFAGGDNSAENINAQLRRAFSNDSARGIILQINSPGGSAVESHRIYKEIRRLRNKYPDKKLYAVAGDFCASGGYFIAAAADKIYADEGSILGSIGVVFSSFGFVGTLEKLGVERRVITAGTNKNMLDPFSPERGEDVVALRRILLDVHKVFIDAVKAGRGAVLSDSPALFSGAVFGGAESLRLGLIDGFNDSGGVARDMLGVDEIVYYDPPKDVLGELLDSFLIHFRTNLWNAGARTEAPAAALN